MTNFQLIEINSWDSVPVDLPIRVYLGDLESARKRFAECYGRDCKVAYALRNQWLMVIPPEFEVEVEK